MRTSTVWYTANAGRSYVPVTFVCLLAIVLVVMLSPFPSAYSNLLPSAPIPPVSSSTGYNHWGGTPPLNHGLAAWTPRLPRSMTDSGWLRAHGCPLHAPPRPHTYSSTHTTPLHATTSATHSHPPHDMSANWIKLCFQNIPLREASARLNRCVALRSVNFQPWCFTNNSLGLPHAHSLSVCLFLWFCVVCVCFLLYLSLCLCCERYVLCVWFCFHRHLLVLFLVFLRLQ